MAGFSDYLENQIISTFVSNGAKYVQLHTADPTDAGTAGVLASANRASATFSAPSNGATSNSGEVLITYTGASAATVTHVSIWDAASGGNMLYSGTTTNKTLNQNDSYRYATGQLSISNAD